jgi:lysophospholipase L1-like esterase
LNVGTWSPAYLQARVQALAQWWYADPKLDGIRWNRLVGDLETLNRTGARLIVVLMPAHPAFMVGAHNTTAGRAECTFRMRVRGVCERLGVPCLDYGSDCLKPCNPDLLFHDLIHLNRDGAPAFSEVLARDLAPLLRKPA